MNIVSTYDSTTQPGFITPCSILHLLSGVFSGQAFKHITNFNTITSAILWFIIHGLREVKDYKKSQNIKDEYLDNNSIHNCIGDQIVAMIGFFIGDYLPKEVWIYYTTLLIVAFTYIICYTLKLR